MSIDGVTSYGEIYDLTEDDIELYDSMGVEWRGRNVLDVRDDFCIKNIVRFAQIYLLTSLTNPKRLPELKAEIVDIFETVYETEDDEEEEPSVILYRFDPISRTYHEIIGAEGKRLKAVGKCFKKVGKGVKKVKHAVGKKVRQGGRWVREHPVETGVIVVAAVTLGVGAAAIAGAGSAAVNSGSDHDKHSSRDNKSSSPHYSSSNSTSSTNYDPPSEIQGTSSNWSSEALPTSNSIVGDLSSSWNSPYKISEESNVRNYSTLAHTVPTSLTHEYKTYSVPASIADIPRSSSYAVSSKDIPTSTNTFPNSSPPIDRHSMEFSMAQPTAINPSTYQSSLFPGYQEPQTAHLSARPSKVTSDTNPVKEEHPKEESWADFAKGVSNGFPRGCEDSIKETPSTLWTFVKMATGYAADPFIHPLKHLPGQEIVSQTLAVYETIEYLRTCEDGEVSKATGELIRAVAPEAHQLFTNWENLSLEERGDLSAYCLGKYGTDFLLPIAAAKGAKVVGGVLKEASVLGKLEGVIGAGAEVSATKNVFGNAGKVLASETLITEEVTAMTSQKMVMLEKVVSQSESTVYKSAISQNKHVKMVRDYLDKPAKEIQKGINSYEKQIAIHKDKIAKPTQYYPDWDKLDPRQREALINKKWPAEIQGYEEQKSVLQSILNERLSHE